MAKYFIDTSILQAAFNIRDREHSRSRALLDKVIEQGDTKLYVSDYILDEVISLIIARTRDKGSQYSRSIINDIYNSINDSQLYKIFDVDDITYGSALIYVKGQRYPLATLTDYKTVVFMRRNKIRNILSYDHHFDEISRIKEFKFIKRIYDAKQL